MIPTDNQSGARMIYYSIQPLLASKIERPILFLIKLPWGRKTYTHKLAKPNKQENKKQRRGLRRRTYIRRVTDELTEEDLLVAVESVDDQAEKLVDFSLEGEGLCVSHLNFRHRRDCCRKLQESASRDFDDSILSRQGGTKHNMYLY